MSCMELKDIESVDCADLDCADLDCADLDCADLDCAELYFPIGHIENRLTELSTLLTHS